MEEFELKYRLEDDKVIVSIIPKNDEAKKKMEKVTGIKPSSKKVTLDPEHLMALGETVNKQFDVLVDKIIKVGGY